MKRTISKLRSLIGFGLVTLATFLVTTPAHAVVTENTITRNGVTCYQRIGGTYPENGLYYYCGVKPATKTPLQNASTGFSTTCPYVAGNLSTKGVFIYIFRNAVEAAK